MKIKILISKKQLNKQAVLMKILTTMVDIYKPKIYYLLTLLKNAKENAKRQQNVNSGLGQKRPLTNIQKFAT